MTRGRYLARARSMTTSCWNRIKRIQGHIDIPLADTGLAQAQRLAARLGREARDGARIDAVYSSDLMRAQQTAQILGEQLHAAIVPTQGLSEIGVGAWLNRFWRE